MAGQVTLGQDVPVECVLTGGDGNIGQEQLLALGNSECVSFEIIHKPRVKYQLMYVILASNFSDRCHMKNKPVRQFAYQTNTVLLYE